MPGRRNLAPEQEYFPGRTVYLLRYRARRGASAWRVLYELLDADEDGTADTVRVLRVRHAAVRSTNDPVEEDEEDDGKEAP